MRGLRILSMVALLLGTWMLGTSAADEQTVILLADHTQGWHVKGAVEDWNENGDVRFVRTSSCLNRTRCVDVWARYDQVGVLGLTYPAGPNPQVWMNARYFTLGKHVRRQAVCHELGHVLGLGHHRGSCMKPIADGDHRHPSAADLATVRDLW